MFKPTQFVRTSVLASLLSAGASAGLINDYNLIVTGNLNSTSNVHGRTWVGGSLTTTASDYGTQLTPSANYTGVDVLRVGGNIFGGNINLQAGTLRRAGTRSGNVNLNGVGSAEIVDASLAAQSATLSSQLMAYSSAFQAMGANSTVTMPSGQPGPAKFIATPSTPGGTAVFFISNPSALFSSSLVQQIELVVNSASAIVVNVAGTTINVNGGNFVGAWSQAFARANTIWNFYEATTLNIDRNFNGAVLAPLATLTNTTNIDGSVFVKNMTQRGEVHMPMYSGADGVPVPLPTGAGLAVAGLALVGMRRRR